MENIETASRKNERQAELTTRSTERTETSRPTYKNNAKTREDQGRDWKVR